MSPARRAFLAALIDYAGLFPPAKLNLDAALQEYLHHLKEEQAWMIGRFIIPGAQLENLMPYRDALLAAGVRFSVLGLPGETPARASMETVRVARDFEDELGRSVACDRFELKLPLEAVGTDDAVGEVLLDIDEALRPSAERNGEVIAALELPITHDKAPSAIERLAAGVAEHNARGDGPTLALKFRCGGVTPDLVPDAERLGAAIATSVRHGAPFKATAGLHHPFPNDDDAVGARMHGFVNVFGAAVLAAVHDLDAGAVAEILHDDDASHFALEERLSWRSLRASAEQVDAARRTRALSYGSCSFEEPREDLQALGWL